jgi:hypothetical protein
MRRKTLTVRATQYRSRLRQLGYKAKPTMEQQLADA